MHRSARTRAVERADRAVALHLRDEHDIAVDLDRDIRGLAAVFHQTPQRGAADFGKLAVAQERAADAEGLHADEIIAVRVVEDEAVRLQRRENPVRR
jgi:hypothetical protein